MNLASGAGERPTNRTNEVREANDRRDEPAFGRNQRDETASGRDQRDKTASGRKAAFVRPMVARRGRKQAYPHKPSLRRGSEFPRRIREVREANDQRDETASGRKAAFVGLCWPTEDGSRLTHTNLASGARERLTNRTNEVREANDQRDGTASGRDRRDKPAFGRDETASGRFWSAASSEKAGLFRKNEKKS